MTAILTKYHPWTTTKPARISATFCGNRDRVYISVPMEDQNEEQRHFKAAEALCKKMGFHGVLVGGWINEGEFVFCFVTYSATPREKGGFPLHQLRYIVE